MDSSSCTNPCQLESPIFTPAWGPYIIYKTLTNTADPASMDRKLKVLKAWKTTSSKADTALYSHRCSILMVWFRGFSLFRSFNCLPILFLKAAFILMTFQLSPWLSLKLIRFAWVVLSLKGKSAVTFLFLSSAVSQETARTQ